MNELKDHFYRLYGKNGNKLQMFFAPGRVNLIGEHTDYNGGYVLPAALNYGTYLLVRQTAGKELKFASLNFEYRTAVLPENFTKKHAGQWVNYPLGVINQLTSKGIQPEGLELLYYGDIPNGAGLSSSASIEMVTAYMLNKIYAAGIPILELIKLSQKAENEFVGVNCGIMDQFAVGKGQKDAAVFLNCDTLDHEIVPLNLGDYRLVITNTNKKRKLADSKYNERRQECEQAVKHISKKKQIKNLGELSLAEFTKLQHLIPNETVRRRAWHVVSENDRVLKAVNALKANDLKTFGKLMNESHYSLRDYYEVTGFELDTLTDYARNFPGCLGSRMTGAGFGGCTVSLVHKDNLREFINVTGTKYLEKTGLKPAFYQPEISGGPRELPVEGTN